MNKCKKLISILLSFLIISYSVLPYGFVMTVRAQEATPETTEAPSPSSDPTSDPNPSTNPTESPTEVPTETTSPSPTGETSSSPTSSPASSESSVSPTSTPEPTQTPQPTPTIPPYWSDDYDVWKAEQEKIEAEQNAREREWEAHEEDQAWIAAHGGNEWYFVSGQWQKDEDARIAAEKAAAEAEAARLAAEQAAAAAAAQDNQDVPGATEEAGTDVGINDPCGNNTTLVGTTDALADAAGGLSVTNDNCLYAGNTGTAAGISGENSQTGIDGDVSTTTGNASGTGTIVNVGNTTTTSTSPAGGSGNAIVSGAEESMGVGSGDELTGENESGENLVSGAEPTDLTQTSDGNTLGVNNTNEAYVNNELNVQGVSGQDVQTCNDGDATLTTGDIELIANMLNILNLNITGDEFMHLIVNIFGTLNGTLDLDDIASALGLSSDEDLEIIAQAGTSTPSPSSGSAAINNDNTAVVNNDMNVTGVSGQSNVSGNDGTVDVVTGRIKILANLMNFINANFSGEKWSFIMINIFGKLTGDIILPDTSSYLGDASTVEVGTMDGEAVANTSQDTSVSNNNDVTLNNNIEANGITGENSQVGNDGKNTTNPGEVDVVTRLVNFLNFNITGNNWVFLVVNVFGKWMGKIVNFAGKDMAAPTDGSFAALSVGDGSGGVATSQGSTSSDTSSSTDVNNNNDAIINNNMDIDGVSGQNSVNGNEGNTSLTTGWVEIDANLLNIINMNVTGRSWMIVFLNIFGDFAGNLFFGAPPKPVVVDTSTADNTDTQSGTGGVDFNMGDSGSGSQDNSSSNAGQESNAGNSQVAQPSNQGMATIHIVNSLKGKRKIIRQVVSVPQVLSYHSKLIKNNTPSYIYFSLFGKQVKIPKSSIEIFLARLKKLFPQIALKGELLLAHK